MGLDALGCFKTTERLSDEELAAANAAIVACYGRWFLGLSDTQEMFVRPTYDPDQVLGPTAIEIRFHADRFYGIGYERGPFWRHYTVIEWVRRRHKTDDVFYGSDGGDLEHCIRITPADARRTLEHWLQLGHQPYYQETRCLRSGHIEIR